MTYPPVHPPATPLRTCGNSYKSTDSMCLKENPSVQSSSKPSCTCRSTEAPSRQHQSPVQCWEAGILRSFTGLFTVSRRSSSGEEVQKRVKMLYLIYWIYRIQRSHRQSASLWQVTIQSGVRRAGRGRARDSVTASGEAVQRGSAWGRRRGVSLRVAPPRMLQPHTDHVPRTLTRTWDICLRFSLGQEKKEKQWLNTDSY